MTPLAPLRPTARRPLAAGLFTLLAAVLLLASGCQTRFPSEQIPKMKWLITDFRQPRALSEQPTAVRGWWFTARTIRQNPRAGTMMTEALQRRMAQLDFVNLYSPLDLRYYFAGKRELLKEAWPDLTDEQREELLAQVPPLEFARELGADKLLTGRILRQYMGENRTIHWWWATLEAEAQVIDVASGRVERTYHYFLRDQSSSDLDLQEKFAERLIRDMKRDYFLPLARP